MRAAEYGKTECVQLLLSAGADINFQDKVSNNYYFCGVVRMNMCEYYDNFIFLVIVLFLDYCM